MNIPSTQILVSDTIFPLNALEFLGYMADSRTRAGNIHDEPAELCSPGSKDVLKTK